MKWLDKLRRKKNTEPDKNGARDIDSPISAGEQSREDDRDMPFPEVEAALYPREKEVFKRLLKDAKMKEIAAELGIETSTVNGYCRDIYRKLGVNSKAQLILRYAVRWEPADRGGVDKT